MLVAEPALETLFSPLSHDGGSGGREALTTRFAFMVRLRGTGASPTATCLRPTGGVDEIVAFDVMPRAQRGVAAARAALHRVYSKMATKNRTSKASEARARPSRNEKGFTLAKLLILQCAISRTPWSLWRR